MLKFNPTTQIVADHVIPYYLKRGDRHLLYMNVGQEVTDMARKILSCETDYEGKDGEMFPQWATLVCCPRTYNLIQWAMITYEINRIAEAEAEAVEAAEAKEAWEREHMLNCVYVGVATYVLSTAFPAAVAYMLLGTVCTVLAIETQRLK